MHKTIDLIHRLLVYPKRMEENLDRTHGLIFSQGLMLGIVGKGKTREEAYQLIQRNAMACWKSGEDFKDVVRKDEEIAEILDKEEIEEYFDLRKHLRNVDHIFRRVGLLK